MHKPRALIISTRIIGGAERLASFLRDLSEQILDRTPVAPLAAGLVVGVVLDDRFAPAPGIWWTVFLIAAATVFLRGGRSVGAYLVLAASIGVGGMLHYGSARAAAATSIAHCVENEERLVRLRGVVSSQPVLLRKPETPFSPWTFGADRTALILDVQSVQGPDGDVETSGRVRVTVLTPVLDLRQGEAIEVFGSLYRLHPPDNPGSFQWARHLRRQGVVAGLRCATRENVRRLKGNAVPDAGLIARTRARLRELLLADVSRLDERYASLLDALILGRRSGLDQSLNDAFINAGCAHLVAVSGLHLAIPISFAWGLCRLLGRSRRFCALAGLAAAVAYALIVEPRPPVLRAVIVATLFCGSVVFRRRTAAVNSLSVAACILLIVQPTTVFSIGFQLSFAAVLGVLLLPNSFRSAASMVRRWMERVVLDYTHGDEDRLIRDTIALNARGWPRSRVRLRKTVHRWIVYPMLMSVAAWLASMPIVASQFQQVHLLGPLSTLVLLPLVYALVLTGFFKILTSLMMPTLGTWIGPAITPLSEWLGHVAEWFGNLPSASLSLAAPPWWWIVIWYLLLVAWIAKFHLTRSYVSGLSEEPLASPPIHNRRSTLALAASFMAVVMASWLWWYPADKSDRLAITCLSVGAGSATVVELPNGETVIYDAGSLASYDVGAAVIVPFLRARGIRRINRLYISHPNLDHFSAVPTLLRELPVDVILVNPYFDSLSAPRSPSRHLLDLLSKTPCPVETMAASTTSWTHGGVLFEYLHPPPALDDEVTPNDTSTVVKLTYRGRSVLLTGDIEESGLRNLIQQGGLEADILVLPHHGGVERSTREFVSAVGPSIAIRSSQRRTNRSSRKLRECLGGVRLLNTGDVGAVIIEIDEDGVTAWGFRRGHTEPIP